MAQLLVRSLDEETIRRLKALASRHGRSLQGHVKLLLEEAALLSVAELDRVLGKWDRRFAGRRFRDSTRLVREDRRR